MPPLSDHIRRDAEHAARALIGIELARYRRRMEEQAKGQIKETIEQATADGGVLDGTELGQAAAARAIRSYIGVGGAPTPAIEAAAD